MVQLEIQGTLENKEKLVHREQLDQLVKVDPLEKLVLRDLKAVQGTQGLKVKLVTSVKLDPLVQRVFLEVLEPLEQTVKQGWQAQLVLKVPQGHLAQRESKALPEKPDLLVLMVEQVLRVLPENKDPTAVGVLRVV